MSKPSSRWSSTKRQPKTEFQKLLCGTSKPILESWKEEATQSERPPWAPKANHQRTYDETEIVYLAKIKALTEMSDHIYQRNLKIKYRLNAVAKEIKSLKRVKRVLCRRLFDHNSTELSDTFLEIPDNDANTIVVDQIIGDVVNTAQKSVAADSTAPVPKKRKRESKAISNPVSAGATAVSDDTPQQNANEDKDHINSVINDVLADARRSNSNGPTPAKKSRKQNLAALASPTKDALIFTNVSSHENGTTPANGKKGANNTAHSNNLGDAMNPQNNTKTELLSSTSYAKPQNDYGAAPVQYYVRRETVYPKSSSANALSNFIPASTAYPAQTASAQNHSQTFSSSTSGVASNSTHVYVPRTLEIPASTVRTTPGTHNGQAYYAQNDYSATAYPSSYAESRPSNSTAASTNMLNSEPNANPDQYFMQATGDSSSNYYTTKIADEHNPAASMRDNLKSLVQSRMNNGGGQIVPNNEDTSDLRPSSYPPAAATSIGHSNSNLF